MTITETRKLLLTLGAVLSRSSQCTSHDYEASGAPSRERRWALVSARAEGISIRTLATAIFKFVNLT
jgi:hypothetical protein